MPIDRQICPQEPLRAGAGRVAAQVTMEPLQGFLPV